MSSLQAQPTLTPRNTLTDLDWGDQQAGEGGMAREMRFDEGLEEDERGWFDADQDADDEEEDDARSLETASLASSSASEHAFDPESSWP